ncbi:MAG TPA: hypothetical protein VEG30_04585 [Terriglobales bacterium]|nr:hypothetical protein [Terriglobales bacterium]
MNRKAIQRYGTSDLPIARLTLSFLILFVFCNAAAFAQSTSQPSSSTTPFSVQATHLLGFAGARDNANGTVSLDGDVLKFETNGSPAKQIKTASVQDVFVGDESKQVGGLPMTLGKAAAPYGGGRVVSLFAHKKYDTLALEYVDANGAIHGAIFQLNPGQGEVLKNELIARGAHASHKDEEPSKQSTAEVTRESK